MGRAPTNHRLEIRKRFISATSPVLDASGDEGPQRYYEDIHTKQTAQYGRCVRVGRQPVDPPAGGRPLRP